VKRHDVQQGSPEWLKLRLGIPTASEFEKIVTPTGKLSAQARKYAHRLIAEGLLQTSLDSIDGLEWIARGKELEPDAVKLYEFENDVTTEAVGFITSDDGLIGCSPDRLVGDAGLLEVKCPAPQTHVGYFLDGFGNDYVPQVQGQLYVAEREWCAKFSYHPEFPPVSVTTYRDEPFIKLLASSLSAFNDMKAEMLERIRAQGFFAARGRVVTPHEAAFEAA
jgi:hypothetical protein